MISIVKSRRFRNSRGGDGKAVPEARAVSGNQAALKENVIFLPYNVSVRDVECSL
jgi:hypothetical protein